VFIPRIPRVGISRAIPAAAVTGRGPAHRRIGSGRRAHPRRRGLTRLLPLVGAAALCTSALLVPEVPAAAAAPRAANTPVVGIHDSSIRDCDGSEAYTETNPNYRAAAAAITHPSWSGLHVGTIRVSVPWDIAYHDRTSPAGKSLEVEQVCFNYWLTAAAAHHLTPEVAFKPDYNYLDPTGKKIRVPDIGTYEAAMNSFTALYSNCTSGGTASTCNLPTVDQQAGWAAYPAGTGGMARVTTIAPWGEPNFQDTTDKVGFARLPQTFAMPQGGSTFDDPHCNTPAIEATCGPVLAAQMWVALQHRCPSCTVIAGDFSSSGGLETRYGSAPYLDTYNRYLKDLHGGTSIYHPTTWALHPYTDVSSFEYNTLTHHALTPLPQTLIGTFATALHHRGYNASTHIWLDEVSAFAIDMFHNHQHYTDQLQAQAATYLITQLTHAGGASTPGEPVVTQLYYLRYTDGAGHPDVALVVADKARPVYWAIAHRPAPQL
jgi:hypothetical protein